VTTMTEPSAKSPKVASGAEPEASAGTAVKVAPRPKRSTKSVAGAVAALAGAATIAAFGGLWLQMAQGNDPVLASKASPQQPRKVIKKIVVVEKTVPNTSYGSSGSSYGYSGSSGSYSSGSSSVSPAPVAVAPAPAPVVSQPS